MRNFDKTPPLQQLKQVGRINFMGKSKLFPYQTGSQVPVKRILAFIMKFHFWGFWLSQRPSDPQCGTHPASQSGKFQRSKIQQYIQNKNCQYILGGYETCFGISLDPKTIRWESKRAKNHSIQDFFNHVKLSNIYKLEADILQQLTSSIFKFQFQVSISSFNFKFQFQVLISSFNFKF